MHTYLCDVRLSLSRTAIGSVTSKCQATSHSIGAMELARRELNNADFKSTSRLSTHTSALSPCATNKQRIRAKRSPGALMGFCPFWFPAILANKYCCVVVVIINRLTLRLQRHCTLVSLTCAFWQGRRLRGTGGIVPLKYLGGGDGHTSLFYRAIDLYAGTYYDSV